MSESLHYPLCNATYVCICTADKRNVAGGTVVANGKILVSMAPLIDVAQPFTTVAHSDVDGFELPPSSRIQSTWKN